MNDSSSDPSGESPPQPARFIVDDESGGERLDVFVANRLTEHSRTLIRKGIDAGAVQVDGERTKVAYKLIAGQIVTVDPIEIPHDLPQPEDIPLEILYEDEQLVAINKSPGMVVHPAKGHWSGTLVSALAFHFQSLSSIGGPTRPGIVHRLDRDTSGVIVVAKDDKTHAHLSRQFEKRTVHKQYLAICRGVLDRDRDRIDQPIGVHPNHREKMCVRSDDDSCRQASTEYEVLRRFDGFSYLSAYPKTGRTHQIRVHLCYAGYPVACDRAYSGHSQITLGELTRKRDDATVIMGRQALHARLIKISHPATDQSLVIEAPIPADFQNLLSALQTHR